MAITRVDEVVQVDGVSVRRRVEERTNRIEILTPFNEEGPGGYSAVAYREWVEYQNDVPVKITTLEPLHIPIVSQFTLLSGIAYRIDMIASRATQSTKWPRVNGVQQKP